MSYYFRTEKMSVGYDGRPLIEAIDIQLLKGEILVLIGPNGGGKSTVLRSIAGQLEKVAGTVYLDGKNISRISPGELSRKMSLVLTDRLRGEWMTCREVVATGRYPYTGPFGLLSGRDLAAVEEAVRLAGVEEIAERDFNRVSDGQRQRVMLARAICQEPEILILDEPTSYLDVKYKLEFLSALQRMKREKGLTVILSLHELDLAKKVGDKILCLNGACAEGLGTPEEVFWPGHMEKLFGVSLGSFDENTGGMELPAPPGEPEIFVIAGNGTGGNIYRRLQREGRAFVTGILFTNDLDYPVARALSAQVLQVPAFERVPSHLMEAARSRIDACRQVICCRRQFGTLEEMNRRLYEYAVEKGKLIPLSKGE